MSEKFNTIFDYVPEEEEKEEGFCERDQAVAMRRAYFFERIIVKFGDYLTKFLLVPSNLS